jgi:hypothetical protein
MVVELGEAAGIFKLNKDLQERALSVTAQDYVKGEVAAGRINQQQLKVSLAADLRKMPPKLRKEIQQTQQRVVQTARKYKGGANVW